MPFFKQAMLDCIVGKYGEKYSDEIGVVWWTRGDVEDTHERTPPEVASKYLGPPGAPGGQYRS